MKSFIPLITLFLFDIALLAQAPGNKPEWVFNKYGSYDNGFQPVKVGDILGDIRFNGYSLGEYLLSSKIQAVVTSVNSADVKSDIKFFTGGQNLLERISISSSGNIIIKNSNLSVQDSNLLLVNGKMAIGTEKIVGNHKLYVNGSIICTKIKISYFENWPDYVFNNDYLLMDLDTLQKYIYDNKHLPNVPSNSKIVKDGLDLGEIQKIMMEKIEEMYLYILDLKHEIDILKKG